MMFRREDRTTIDLYYIDWIGHKFKAKDSDTTVVKCCAAVGCQNAKTTHIQKIGNSFHK